MAVNSFHQSRNDVELAIRSPRRREFTPRDHAENTDVHHDIETHNRQYRKEQRARNIFRRILDLISEEADVVVTADVVRGDEQSAAQSVKEITRKRKCAGRNVECLVRIEMSEAGKDDPSDG